MILYPAIDMLGGRAVRLKQGRREDATDYGEPLDRARMWTACGAAWLHLVDLSAAFGEADQLAAVETIARAKLGAKLQLGGGIRSLADIERRLSAGVDRVILGTVALRDPALVREACRAYPGRIVCGIDARDDRVAVQGWAETSSVTALELALRMRDAGIRAVVYTDISRDGMLGGVNVEATVALARDTGLEVIASGGVAGLADIVRLRDAGVAGAIAGKALYEGTLDLREAIEAARG